jgi:hypothetical protein
MTGSLQQCCCLRQTCRDARQQLMRPASCCSMTSNCGLLLLCDNISHHKVLLLSRHNSRETLSVKQQAEMHTD